MDTRRTSTCASSVWNVRSGRGPPSSGRDIGGNGAMTPNRRDLADAEAAEEGGGGGGRWQGAGEHEAGARVVLHCVLARCAARELWRCGAVCRAWRRAAADAHLWRRLLRPRARPAALAALAELNECHHLPSSTEAGDGSWWRGQYALSAARWRRRGALASSADGAALAAAALHRAAPLLALLRDDGNVTVWSSRPTGNDAADPASWQKRWEGGTGGEWRSGADARWAPRASRLLVAGTLALADRFEVIIYDFDDVGHGVVSCRAAAGGGAAGCWVDDAAFLTLELRVLTAHHACTTLWLNAATQKTQSEHTGVTTPLLRIYNEAAADISDVAVVELPRESEGRADSGAAAPADAEVGPREPDAAYYRALAATHPPSDSPGAYALIAAGGAPGGPRGCGRALLLWRLPRPLTPPPLLVRDGLAERVRRRRERPDPPPPLPEPDEAAVRAICAPPHALCRLPSQVLGFVVHPNGRCVWAYSAAGAACASLPELRPLLWLPSARPPAAPLPPPALPAVDDHLFIIPAAGGSSSTATSWLVRGGATGAALAADAPALAACLLPRAPPPSPPPSSPALLLLTANALEVWQIQLP